MSIVERLREKWKHIYEAADEIERLRAKIAEQEEWNSLRAMDIVTLGQEVGRLREALEPFAKAADQLDKEKWDDGSIEGSLAYVTGSHCRSARAALADKKTGHE